MTLEILAFIVLINAMATIALWSKAARRPEKLKKKFLKRLWRSKPITPNHKPPPPLKSDAWGVHKKDLQFFSDFVQFANVVNRWLADDESQWRLQELPDPELRALSAGSPTYGRRSDVFHNQVRVGTLELRANPDYSTRNPSVVTHLEIEWARLLSFGSIQSFLREIALHTCEPRPGTAEYLQAHQQIDRAMMAALWQNQEISQFGMLDIEGSGDYGRIKLRLDGLASFYIDRRQTLVNKAAA